MKVGSLLAQVFENQSAAVENSWSDERPQQWAYFIYDSHGCFLGRWYGKSERRAVGSARTSGVARLRSASSAKLIEGVE